MERVLELSRNRVEFRRDWRRDCNGVEVRRELAVVVAVWVAVWVAVVAKDWLPAHGV